MEKRFKMLLDSYKDNYIQYKMNGEDRYKSSYESAQSAIETLFKEAGTIPAKTPDNSELAMKLIRENDNAVGAEMRVPVFSFLPAFYSYNTQYIVIGCLGAITLLLVIKPWSLLRPSL
jgi:hypothetical protein